LCGFLEIQINAGELPLQGNVCMDFW